MEGLDRLTNQERALGMRGWENSRQEECTEEQRGPPPCHAIHALYLRSNLQTGTVGYFPLHRGTKFYVQGTRFARIIAAGSEHAF
jgi:hypothetical protein